MTSDSATIFVARYKPNGAHVWSKRYRSGGGEVAVVTFDSSGNALITGAFQNIWTPYVPVAVNGGDNWDAFVLKVGP